MTDPLLDAAGIDRLRTAFVEAAYATDGITDPLATLIRLPAEVAV